MNKGTTGQNEGARNEDGSEGKEPLFHMEKAISEWEERKKRNSNVLVMNVNESTKHNKEERTQDETDRVRRLFSELQLTGNGFKVFRIGKFDPDKVRLLKVIFNNESDARHVIYNRNKIPGNVKVFRDQTKVQRDYYKCIKEKLKEYTDRGDTTKTIKYINSIPTIVNVKN